MRKLGLFLAVVVVYVLHQDVWLWRSARPLVLGLLPAGLAYHAAYSVLAAGLMWLLVRAAWPARLEREADQPAERPTSEP